ncbi:hypothetical protein FQR65_LT06411 [Abscondita terminalis]|nr:hypothetical protein FQR65_LT06411 [Abscondita terminalis]
MKELAPDKLSSDVYVDNETCRSHHFEKSIGDVDFSESSDSNVDMSLHDIDSSIGPEDCREEEEETSVSYPKKDGLEGDKALEDRATEERRRDKENEGRSVNTVKKHRIHIYGKFCNDFHLVEKRMKRYEMKRYRYSIGQVKNFNENQEEILVEFVRSKPTKFDSGLMYVFPDIP